MLPSLRTVDDDLEEALMHIEDFEFEAALPILARVVAFAPDNALAYEIWTFCHVQLGRFERAIQIADEGLVRGISPAALHQHKSEALRRLQRFDEAAAAADVALALEPESGSLIRTRAAVEVDRGEHDRAIRLLQQALQRQPDDAELHFSLLVLADELDRHSLIIELARDFLRKFEKDAEVLSMLGNAYAATRDYRRADRAFRDAAQFEPEQAAHHVNVLMVALATNNTAAFDSYLDRLAERDPEMADRAEHEVNVLLTRSDEESDNPERNR